jgi:hypothetical protein
MHRSTRLRVALVVAASLLWTGVRPAGADTGQPKRRYYLLESRVLDGASKVVEELTSLAVEYQGGGKLIYEERPLQDVRSFPELGKALIPIRMEFSLDGTGQLALVDARGQRVASGRFSDAGGVFSYEFAIPGRLEVRGHDLLVSETIGTFREEITTSAGQKFSVVGNFKEVGAGTYATLLRLAGRAQR